jgi:glutamine amidotransferase
MKIVIVDYGMGNIKSLVSTLKYLGVSDVLISSKFEDLQLSTKIILPGVGSFGKAMKQIRDKKLDVYLNELVIENKKPILGICLGMQLMGLSSTEDGFNKGLGFVNSIVSRFDNLKLKIPHVGFNQVKINNNLKLYNGLIESPDFYFTHSFKMTSDHDINQCYCDYGSDFIASFEVENVAGVQFHPELSQNNGLKLLKNFIEKF